MHYGTMFWEELVYSLIVLIFCSLIYIRTKEIYNLTRHKGIHYFRTAFLFLGFSYLGRFILHLIMASLIAMDYFIPRGALFPITIVPVSYLSTMAILFLTYGMEWKKLKIKNFNFYANVISILVAFTTLILRSPIVLSLIQLPLIIFILFISTKHYIQTKKKTSVLYFFVGLLWLISLFLIGPRKLIPSEISLLLHIISISVFIIIYYKVAKWTK